MGVDEVRAKVQRILIDQLGSVEVGSDNQFWLYNDSAVGRVDVIDWGDGDTIVQVGAGVIREVPLTPEVFEWVATEGQSYWFAKFRVFRSSDNPSVGILVLQDELLGNSIDPDELMWAARQVMRNANELDEELQKKFGGLLAREQGPE